MSKQDTKLTPQILAMYIENCEAIANTQRGENWRGKLAGIYSDINVHLRMDESGEVATFRPDEVKPILRRLSSMTTEESHWWNARKQRKGFMAQVHADNTLWLCSKSFDLFGLIDAGLAIDAKTLKS